MRLTRSRSAHLGSAVLMLLLCAACSSKDTSTQTTPAQSPMNAAAPSSTSTGSSEMNDAGVAAVVVAANDADIDNAKQAESHTHNTDVQQFAKMMISDHGAVNDKVKTLGGQLNLTPEDNDTSRGLKAEQDSLRQSIGGKSGAAFDRAYIDNEVTYHQHVLDAIDHTLLPDAQNPQLKQLLTDTRPAVAQHLQRAREIQTRLSSSAAR